MSPFAVSNLEESAGSVPTERGSSRVVISGELALAAGALLADALRRAEGLAGGVIFDLTGVEFIDALGAHLLLDANHRVRARGDVFALDGVPDVVMRLLVLLGVDTEFEYVGAVRQPVRADLYVVRGSRS
jgi:anti-anti-sigma factor